MSATESITNKTLKNVSYSSIGYAWSLIFAIFVTPIIVFRLGVDYYGVFIFINTVASLLGLLDLGVSIAVTKYISEYHGGQDQEKLRKLLYSANSLFLLVGLIGLIGFLMVGFFGRHFSSVIAMSSYDVLLVSLMAGLMFFINSINGIYSITPVALQRFDINTKISLAQTTISSVSILIIAILGFKLKAIFLAQLIIAIIFTFIFRHWSQKILSIAKLKLQWHKQEIIRCYKFGLSVSVSNLAGQTLAYFDKLIIPMFLNPTSLSYYSLSSSVASKSTGVVSSMTSVLFPMVSNLKGGQDTETTKKLYIRSFRLTTIMSAAISFAVAFLAYEIMHYWLSEDMAIHTYEILLILTATYFVLSLWIPLKNFLWGLGYTKIMAQFSVVITLFNILLLFFLLPIFGIKGAAIAYLVSVLPTAYMFYFLEKKVLNLENRLIYYIKIYAKIFFTAIIFYFIVKILIAPYMTSFTMLLAGGPLSVLIYLGLFKIFGFYEKEDINSMKNFYHIAIKRIKR